METTGNMIRGICQPKFKLENGKTKRDLFIFILIHFFPTAHQIRSMSLTMANFRKTRI